MGAITNPGKMVRFDILYILWLKFVVVHHHSKHSSIRYSQKTIFLFWCHSNIIKQERITES
uniref:Putative ovule protein n=1 Tax=Solanum chacoense TaxID=4108 RepID=A0A0V0GZC6_SOLCH